MSSATLFLRNVAYIGYLKHICHCHQKLCLKSSSHFLFENITYVGSLKYFVFLHVFMMTYKQIYGHWTSRISTFRLDLSSMLTMCRCAMTSTSARWTTGAALRTRSVSTPMEAFTVDHAFQVACHQIWSDMTTLQVWGCLSGFVGNQNIGCSNRPGIWWVLRVFKKIANLCLWQTEK